MTLADTLKYIYWNDKVGGNEDEDEDEDDWDKDDWDQNAWFDEQIF